MDYPFTKEQLLQFHHTAAKNAYAAGGAPIPNPERPGFYEYIYIEGQFSYRDSYTGHYKSRGMEVIRYEDKPVWCALYGGGMTEGNNSLADQTFDFLKKSFSTSEEGFESFRGPRNLKDGDWEYKYQQEGGIYEFSGYEEICYQGNLVFFHRIIGGVVEH